MAIIQKPVRLEGSKGEKEVVAIFDSGATYSCITPKLARELEVVVNLPQPMEFSTAKEGESLSAKEAIRLNFYIDGYRFSDEFMLIPGLSEPVIIGAKTLQAWRMKLDFEADEVIIDPRVTKLRLLSLSTKRLFLNQIIGLLSPSTGRSPHLRQLMPIISRKGRRSCNMALHGIYEVHIIGSILGKP